MFNFIDYLLKVTENTESPEEFWRWAGISCLSIVLRDNVYAEIPILGKIYPNMYVILFGDSGIVRKGGPCKFVGKLIQAIGNTKFINGRSSMQAVVRELGLSYTNKQGFMITGASGAMYTEELASFAIQDPATVPLLIDLYDFHENWNSNLVSGNLKLSNVCLSLLAASNSDLFRSTFTEMAIKGGLLGRTMIVKADKGRKRVSMFDMGKKTVQNEQDTSAGLQPLIDHLRKLATIKGPLNASDDAITEYNTWYYDLPDEEFNDKIGFGSRLGTHVIKVALALAAARDDFSCLIEQRDVEEAIIRCKEIKVAYKGIAAGIGYSTTAYQTSLVIKTILAAPNQHIKRKKLIQKLLGDVEQDGLDKIIALLVQGGLAAEVSINMEPGIKITAEGIDVLVYGKMITE